MVVQKAKSKCSPYHKYFQNSLSFLSLRITNIIVRNPSILTPQAFETTITDLQYNLNKPRNGTKAVPISNWDVPLGFRRRVQPVSVLFSWYEFLKF